MPGYSENLHHYQLLEQVIADAEARHRAAIDQQARVEIGTIEHTQLSATVRQCEAELDVAKSAI
jgi:hypothetical protein